MAEHLGYPLAVVHDGQLISWPPVDTRRRDAKGDFGMSGPAARLAGPWYPCTTRETVDRHIASDGYQRIPGSEAALLPVPGTAVLAALEQVIAGIDCDLGFRLLLRTLETMDVPLAKEQYAECEALARRLGYSEFHLLGIEQRIRRD
ncbi:hypothetical protein [Streptomyces sp. NPDC101165]|uniref:hypothetical protein n=1 Tax=Streptomyces sp. NPDC101165 TaxID=3366119 RepID=UPI0037FDB7A3